MNLRPIRWICIALSLALLGGCAALGTSQRPEVPDGAQCLALYAKVDERIEAAGVADAQYARIEGFPYLRSDRFSASFAREIHDMDTFWEWVGYLRANEDEARDIELRNLNLPSEETASLLLDLRGCGAWLRSWELDDAAFREKLYQAVTPPDAYSTLARALGAYPLAKPFLRRGIAAEHQKVLNEFAKPLEQLDTGRQRVLWTVKPGTQQASDDPFIDDTIDLRERPRDLLGRVGLLQTELQQLAQFHAPAFWIETGAAYDMPGVPRRDAQGLGVNTETPVVYFIPGYTRFGGQNLLQISYVMWFSQRAEAEPGDPAAGPLDGLIWRVTLDERGQVLMHDTIHACGCYHYGFIAGDWTLRTDAEANPSGMLFPQAEVPRGPIAVHVQSGTHAVQRVVPRDEIKPTVQSQYELQPYDELTLLPRPGGGTYSLFGPDGLVAGTERRERYWLWPSGVRSAGAMRQWGHHATSFLDRTHFDDPFLFEKVLVAPEKPAPEKGQ